MKSPINFKILQACLIQVNTGDYKEDPRTPSTSTQDSPQTEYDGLLIFLTITIPIRRMKVWNYEYLDDLDDQAEGEGESDDHQDDGGDDQEPSHHTRGLVTHTWRKYEQCIK